MIRSTMTAHLAEIDKQELTLQLNDREIGLLASQRQKHYVMSGNRRVQLIAGLETDRDNYDSVMATRALLRLWLMTFRELQVSGLARFPQCVDRNRLSSDFCFLMDSEAVSVWCDDSFGVYLHRGDRLYRQQPTFPPSHPDLASFCRSLDFYTFRPAENDNILIIDPAFIDLFVPEELEEMFSDTRQLNVSMSELTRLAALSGYPSDTTWFSCQVQKLEHEPEALSVDARERAAGKSRTRRRGREDWPYRMTRSKVVPLQDGNVRVLPSRLASQEYMPDDSPPAPSPIKPPSFKPLESDVLQKDEPALRIRTEDDESSDQKQYKDLDIETLAKPSRLERIKLWNTDGIRRILDRWHHRLTHLFPESRSLSILAYVAMWLVILVIVIAILTSAGRRQNADITESRPLITAPEHSQAQSYEFEVEVVVEASSLRVLSEPDGTILVATVKRGDKVTQLKKPEKDWVLIRLEDGRTGYVLMELLYPNTKPSK
ncbi:MAG: hypothetical protein GX924_06700 [Clostridiaceae bacterium]|nr:hypothetical protein [Clostridiaceae bacterium]